MHCSQSRQRFTDRNALTELDSRYVRVVCNGDGLANAFVYADKRRQQTSGIVCHSQLWISRYFPSYNSMEHLHGHVSMFVQGYLDLEDGPRAADGDLVTP